MKHHTLALAALVLVACQGPSVDTRPCRPASEVQSFYIPGGGTLNLAYDTVPCGGPTLVGDLGGRSLIIMADIGGYVTRVDPDGRTRWTHRAGLSTRINDLQLVASRDSVTYIAAGRRTELRLSDGTVTRRRNAWNGFCDSAGVRCEEHGVRLAGQLYPAQWPRAAIVDGPTIYVADTFGFRVVAYDIPTGTELWAVPGYYPGDIRLYDGRLLVSEEHSNRVYWLDPVTLARTLVRSCDLAPYNDLANGPPELDAAEASGVVRTPAGRAICQGQELFSPGSATQTDLGEILVVDTDNHRVLLLASDGSVLATVSNLNNPMRALLVPAD